MPTGSSAPSDASICRWLAAGIVGASILVICVVHDATLTAYAESVNQTTETLDKTMGDLLKDPGFNALVKAMGFVSERATVADARAKMGSIKNCNDVFATANGNPDERAIGWLTNTLLAGIE